MICDPQSKRHDTLVLVDDNIPKLIDDAEELYGNRLYKFLFRETLFVNDAKAEDIEVDEDNQQPFLYFYPNNEVRIFITSQAKDDPAGALAESAHEIIHSLFAVSNDLIQERTATVLEEGIATYFQAEILKHASNGIRGLITPLQEYKEAFNCVDQLLYLKKDAIIELRKKQPVIALITANAIRELVPELPIDVVMDLVKPICQLKTELSSTLKLVVG